MKSFLFHSIEELLETVNRDTDVSYVVFTGCELVNELADKVPEHVVLCSSSGEFTKNGYSNNAITGFSYHAEEAEIVEICYPPAETIPALREAYEKVKENPNAFALLLCDGLLGTEEEIIKAFSFVSSDFKMIGGTAGDNLNFKESTIYIGRKKVYSAALFFNIKRRTQIIKENLYVPCDKKMRVTDADPQKRVVETFNNRPAAAEYAEALGVAEEDLSKYFMSNPLGRSVGEEIFITSPLRINPDKSITFYSQIIPDTSVDILTLADHESVMKHTLDAIAFKPSFLLSINCILRSLYFIESGRWKDVNEQLLSVCNNQTGFISYGEQYYKNHFNQTMVMLLVE